IVDGGGGAAPDQVADKVAVTLFHREIDGRRCAFLAAKDGSEKRGLAKPALGFADQQNFLAFALESKCCRFRKIVEDANSTDRRRRQNAAAVGFVVERDVP